MHNGISMSFAAACIVLAAVAQAQPAADYSGGWIASFANARGAQRSGSVTIDGSTGTWDVDAQARNNPCAGLKAPVAVTRATPEELVFEIKRSQALGGCPDSTVSLKNLDGKSLEGTFDKRNITLKRP